MDPRCRATGAAVVGGMALGMAGMLPAGGAAAMAIGCVAGMLPAGGAAAMAIGTTCTADGGTTGAATQLTTGLLPLLIAGHMPGHCKWMWTTLLAPSLNLLPSADPLWMPPGPS